MLCLKLIYLIPCQKIKGLILEKLVLDGAEFDFSLILVCDGHPFFCFFIIHENLGLDTKITFLLQPEQKLWHIYRNKVKLVAILDFFMLFVLLHT